LSTCSSPPEESAKKWAEYLALGGVEKALAKARQDYEAGEYQWVAEFTNRLVFADPKNEAARNLCADALEQLAYQAESGPWRNCYLMGALELREGNQMRFPGGGHSFGGDLMTSLTPEMVFDFLGVRLDRELLKDEDFAVRFEVSGTKETYTVYVRYGALIHAAESRDAAVVVQCPRKALLLLALGNGEKFREAAHITGDTAKLDLLLSALHRFQAGAAGSFNIIEP